MSQTQIMFIALAGLMVLVTCFFVVLPLLRHRSDKDTDGAREQAAVALAVLKEQQAELDAETALGLRDPAAIASDRAELERRALEEGMAIPAAPDRRPAKGWAGVVVGFIMLLAVLGYLRWGEPDGLIPNNVQAPPSATDADAIRNMVDGMAARLKQGTGEPKEWVMLARSYVVLEDYDQAVAAFNHLVAEDIPDADVLADWAEAIALQHTKVTPESERLALQALQVDPDHIKALLLAGTATYERDEYALAVGHWQKVLDQQTGQINSLLQDTVNQARKQAGLPLTGE